MDQDRIQGELTLDSSLALWIAGAPDASARCAAAPDLGQRVGEPALAGGLALELVVGGEAGLGELAGLEGGADGPARGRRSA
jgi:hypothetical protein